jgi:hypothetical protein
MAFSKRGERRKMGCEPTFSLGGVVETGRRINAKTRLLSKSINFPRVSNGHVCDIFLQCDIVAVVQACFNTPGLS